MMVRGFLATQRPALVKESGFQTPARGCSTFTGQNINSSWPTSRKEVWRLASPSPTGERSRRPRKLMAGEARIRTVIVDDEAPARTRIRQLLKGELDFEIVAECANGREAVERIIGEKP